MESLLAGLQIRVIDSVHARVGLKHECFKNPLILDGLAWQHNLKYIQGSVLVPILFLIYVSGLPEGTGNQTQGRGNSYYTEPFTRSQHQTNTCCIILYTFDVYIIMVFRSEPVVVQDITHMYHQFWNVQHQSQVLVS